ncbi:nucleotidyl transferase AbiEii/AbiGii toxin family protein, partial [bacterium]|nr:nucleotidyl transferase AbiEii/AbiGii toxin family protein [bacterium]
FDDVAPNQSMDISSWAYDHAATMVDVVDNRAKGVACYHAGYTLVEKLQAISTKYRKQQETGGFPVNFMRHYYDVYCLLQQSTVLEFIGTDDYNTHKKRRFPGGDNPVIAKNEAFLLGDNSVYKDYEQAYQKTKGLYYDEQPEFSAIMKKIKNHVDEL